MYTEAERDEIISLAEKLIKGKEEEINLLRSIISETRYAAPKKLRNKAIKFAGISEMNFLEGKRISLIAETGEDVSTFDFEKMGTSESFPCSLSYDGEIWTFFLPLLPSLKNGIAARNVGRYTGYLMKKLIKDYETEYGKLPLLKSPIIVFEYGIRSNTALGKLFDADNKDNKKILDAMTGHFYEDDNVLQIKTMHKGALADSNYTSVSVMEEDVFLAYLSAISPR